MKQKASALLFLLILNIYHVPAQVESIIFACKNVIFKR